LAPSKISCDISLKFTASSEFMQGIFNRAVVGNISNAFRLVSTIDKQYINAANLFSSYFSFKFLILTCLNKFFIFSSYKLAPLIRN